MPLTLSEIDHPTYWPDQHSLKVTASGCLLDDATPGEFSVQLDEEHLVEMLRAWMDDAPSMSDEFVGVMIHADLAEAVDDMVAMKAAPAALLDWARHLEMLAARLREAAR